MPSQLRGNNDLISEGITPTIPKQRFQKWQQIDKSGSDGIVGLIFVFEKYEIVDPDAMKLFRLALNSTSYDMREASKNMVTTLINRLPMDLENHGINYILPTENEINELEKLINCYYDAIEEIDDYIFDMNFEFQKIFLKKLFDNEVSKRKPLDPKYKVLSTEPDELKELMHYFDNETAYGKNRIETDKRVLEEVERK